MGGDPADHARVRGGESVRRIDAVEAQVTPATVRSNERRPKFIAQPDRRHDVAVSGTVGSVAAGRRVQRRDSPPRHRERLKLVHVHCAEFVGDELVGRGEQRLLGHRAGEQQRRRIRGGEEDRVER
jgi:hypothetical protein